MKKVMCMNMLKALHDLIEDALNAGCVKTLMVAGLHKLVEIAIHVLHADMKLLTEGVEEDI